MLKEGKGEPLDLMRKYYGRSMSAYDDFLDNVNLQAARPDEFAEMILKNVKLVPQFAEGGLAEILQAPKMKHGGRIGFKDGTYRDRLQKDYESLTKGSDFFRTAPPKWWLFPEKYGMTRDDAMTFFKERFMYGDLDAIPTPLEAFKKSPELVKLKEWWGNRKAEGGLAEILQAPRSGMRIGGMGLLTRGLRAALKRTKKGYDVPGADFQVLMDNPSYLMSPVNMQKIKKLEIYRRQLVRDIVRKEGSGEFRFGPKPEATRADLQLLDDYIAQLKKKIKEVGYYGEGAAKEKALLTSTWKSPEGWLKSKKAGLHVPKFVKDKYRHAQGGRAGYSKGRLVKGALAILNRNKKNAEYMFKASDNVSPGYAAGDLKYNAELLADQLAEDAGVVFADLDSISQTKFYGTAYDYLVAEKRSYLEIARKSKEGADSLNPMHLAVLPRSWRYNGLVFSSTIRSSGSSRRFAVGV
jgi:hypothetical protein